MEEGPWKIIRSRWWYYFGCRRWVPRELGWHLMMGMTSLMRPVLLSFQEKEGVDCRNFQRNALDWASQIHVIKFILKS